MYGGHKLLFSLYIFLSPEKLLTRQQNLNEAIAHCLPCFVL